MEVHAHTHTPRKNWSHYFWEFFMLFLAVTLGFFVENQREHLIEHKREKQYIRSLIRDVSTDIKHIDGWTQQYLLLEKNCDSILLYFPENNSFSKDWSRNLFAVLHGFPDFIYTDQTMQQLRNAGGLRLIRNPDARDSIAAYDAAVKDILIEETINDNYFGRITNLTNDELSYRKLSEARNVRQDSFSANTVYWIKYNPDSMEKLFNQVYKYRDEIDDFIIYMDALKAKGENLIGFLKKEYHIN